MPSALTRIFQLLALKMCVTPKITCFPVPQDALSDANDIYVGIQDIGESEVDEGIEAEDFRRGIIYVSRWQLANCLLSRIIEMGCLEHHSGF